MAPVALKIVFQFSVAIEEDEHEKKKFEALLIRAALYPKYLKVLYLYYGAEELEKEYHDCKFRALKNYHCQKINKIMNPSCINIEYEKCFQVHSELNQSISFSRY